MAACCCWRSLWLAKRHHNWTFAALPLAAQAPAAAAQGGRMKTIRRLIYGEVLAAVAFVPLAFLALFFFFDFVDELPYLGKAAAGSPMPATT